MFMLSKIFCLLPSLIWFRYVEAITSCKYTSITRKEAQRPLRLICSALSQTVIIYVAPPGLKLARVIGFGC